MRGEAESHRTSLRDRTEGWVGGGVSCVIVHCALCTGVKTTSVCCHVGQFVSVVDGDSPTCVSRDGSELVLGLHLKMSVSSRYHTIHTSGEPKPSPLILYSGAWANGHVRAMVSLVGMSKIRHRQLSLALLTLSSCG